MTQKHTDVHQRIRNESVFSVEHNHHVTEESAIMVNWKRNLAVIGLSQFLSIMGFSFAMPFAPYYIQELGVHDPVKLKMWIAVFAAATPLSLAIFSPVWGAAADRYGRRPMLLRAYFGSAVLLTLMGTVKTVEALVGLRLLQGAITGTMVAAQTFVSVHTPEEKSGFALGVLNSGVYSGVMAGGLVGGVCSEFFGYRIAFFISGWILVAASLLIVFCTKENFIKPLPSEKKQTTGNEPLKQRLSGNAHVLSILALVAAMSFVVLFDKPFLPLLVQEIHGAIKGAALLTGGLNGVGAFAGLIAGIIMGHLADRIHPLRIAKVSAAVAGLMMIPQALAHGFVLLYCARFGMIFCTGAMSPLLLAWLSKTTPENKRGVVFGWASSAQAIGWMIAPLAGGIVASLLGIRAVYWVAGLLFLALIPFISLTTRRTEKNNSN